MRWDKKDEDNGPGERDPDLNTPMVLQSGDRGLFEL